MDLGKNIAVHYEQFMEVIHRYKYVILQFFFPYVPLEV